MANTTYYLTKKNWLKVIIPVVIAILLGVVIYFINKHEDNPPPKPAVTSEAPSDVVKFHNKETTKTTFEYLSKAVGEDTDVAFERTEAPMVITVNGERHEVSREAVVERQKLENGKLVVTEERAITLELKVPEQPRFKKGIYAETDTNDKNIMAGIRLSYQTEPFDLDLKADLYNKKDSNRITLTPTKWL